MAVSTQSLLLSRRDLQFMLYDWLRLDELSQRPRYAGQTREIYDDVLELAERIATDRFATHNRTSDAREPQIVSGMVDIVPEVKQALDAYNEAGLIGTSVDESIGGMQLPRLLAVAVSAWFHAANAATSSYALLTTAAANMLLVNASREQIECWVPPLLDGRAFGTMCLSEPQAGSSLADISTRAERQPDGTYRIFGTKMWISGGEHEMSENIVHLVLAKVRGAPAGVRGISLFIVPRYLLAEDGTLGGPNDITLVGLNHKMGQRGTVNTVLSFGEGRYRPGDAAGAVSYIVGEPNRGLDYMFRMMNEARLAIGVSATALGYTGYLKSLRYARERLQGRPILARDPLASQVPIIQHPDVKRMLLAQKSYVEGAMALVLYCGRLEDDVESLPRGEARESARLLLEILTPIAKSWPSQWCLEANSLAIQVYGGAGYSRDSDVEQHYRDNRLNPIHEGTHGIQAIDLVGRKIVMAGGAAFDLLVERMTSAAERSAAGTEPGFGQELRAAIRHLADVTAILREPDDRARTLANASIYLEAVGHIVIAWLWLEQLLVISARADPFSEGKRQAARYFYRYELPRTAPQLDLLAELDSTTLDMQEAWF